MLRGLECRFYGKDFSLLFENIDMENYKLIVPENDIFSPDTGEVLSEHMSGSDFIKKLRSTFQSVLFLNCQAYLKCCQQVHEVEDYDEFNHSECQFVILVIDCSYIEIYTKSDTLLMQFIKNAAAYGCDEITIKTDDNDGREKFKVY